jgi:hypothetical protein
MAAKPFKPRVVDPDEVAEKPRPLTTVQAAEANDRLSELQAMRLVIAKAIDSALTPPRDLAALIRRQMDIGREVEVLIQAAEQEANEHGSVADEAWDEAAI